MRRVAQGQCPACSVLLLHVCTVGCVPEEQRISGAANLPGPARPAHQDCSCAAAVAAANSAAYLALMKWVVESAVQFSCSQQHVVLGSHLLLVSWLVDGAAGKLQPVAKHLQQAAFVL